MRAGASSDQKASLGQYLRTVHSFGPGASHDAAGLTLGLASGRGDGGGRGGG